ncbi:sulfatase-like hydrolase/transferase [Fodinibius sp.]|uniref:sulfatase-like hydrolase/transferase n=1 Tax=Fodinibius sp. TaxID=1872440 RepID=UPI002ACE6698|nr:sulfatase-like hydrolase/transferase [Fodinibius sp.]MDZ7658748.1 sulfatase-like hydrolase/transferase [Fodinibius sp.]
MDNATHQKISISLSRVLELFAVLFGVFLLGRSYEIVLGIWNFGDAFVDHSYLWASLFRDLQFSVILLPVLLLFILGLKRIQKSDVANKVLAHLIAFIGIVNIFLISYFGATKMPLGAEFWAYSLNEMTNTVIAAEQVTVVGVGFIIIAYVLMYVLIRKIQSVHIFKKGQTKIVYGILAGIAVSFGFSFFATGVNATPAQQEKYANKLSYFIAQSVGSVDWEANESLDFDPKEYPLLRPANYEKDVLGPFFEEFERPPNIVFLLVESLGGEFIGPSGQWTGFAPYLDSLSQQSLYWGNGLSLSGRTFGLMPSLMGSLPFGRHGFMELGPNYPNHQSLISILDNRGYHTAFYSGYDTYFDGLDFFLDYQGTDDVLNKQRLEKLLPEAKNHSNYWGIDDKTMLEFSAELLDTANTFPRLEIYHTLQSHSPFTVPNAEKYKKQFTNRLNRLGLSEKKKESYRQYQNEFTTLLFADQAVRDFMKSYQKQPQFENTIFVITGDHWLIPVPQTTAISRYHVPIIIYSPKLKKPVRFKSVNTHAEITPSLVAMLDQKTDLDMPEQVHWISGLMDTTKAFQSTQSVPLMRNKNRISDYLDGRYYLFGDELYTVNENLLLSRSNNSQKKEELRKKLNKFKSLNSFVVENNRLYPSNNKNASPSEEYAFLSEYDTLFAKLDSLSLTIDEQFLRARQRAFDGDYEVARAIAKRILLRAPEYHDVRILIGRTNAWQGNYDRAEKYFKDVLEMDSTYFDTYNAYADNEIWQGDYETALQVIERGLKHHPQRKSFLERKIKILSQLDRRSQAQKTYQKLRDLDPDYEQLRDLKEYIGE